MASSFMAINNCRYFDTLVLIENTYILCYNHNTMDKTTFIGLSPAIVEKIEPMIQEITGQHAQNIHSIHVVGSAVMPDYNEKLSDINSLVILRDMDLKFITFLAPLGKKYGKKQIAAPLIMTPEYIRNSIDAFPLEFLDFKLIHATVYGEDILKGMQIDKKPLRLQCEREIKVKLMGLRQGYLSSLGEKKHVAPILVRSITGSMAFFRSIIYLLGTDPPVPRAEVISAVGMITTIETEVLVKLLLLKAGTIKPTEQETRDLFEQYYNTLGSIEKIIDDLHV